MRDILTKYNSYKSFSENKADAYKFVELVGIRICPYCNINYIDVIKSQEGSKILRPDIDHYFCRRYNKKFETCYFNLIPSCLPCNERLKGDINFMKVPHLHPYFHDFDSTMRFYVKLNNSDYMNTDEFDIDISSQANVSAPVVYRAKNNIKTFKISERYAVHKDEAVKIFRNIKYYWKLRRREISNLLNYDGNGIGKKDAFIPWELIIFPEKDCDINQTPLGKLKRDLINTYELN